MDIQSYLDNILFFILWSITLIYWLSLIYTDFKGLFHINFYGTVFTNLLIFVFLSSRWFNYGYFPLSNLYESLLFLAWGVTFTTIVIKFKIKISLIGAVSNPIVLLLLALRRFLPLCQL